VEEKGVINLPSKAENRRERIAIEIKFGAYNIMKYM